MSDDPVVEAVPHEAESEAWLRTNPLSVIARGIGQLKGMIIPLVALFLGGSQFMENSALLLPIFAVIIVATVISAGFTWYVTKYRIGTSDVKLETGLISRAARSVPFERIQDVSLEQKLIPRLLGLVEVRFETGAGGKDELHLAYVSEAEGEALRKTIRALAEDADSAPQANKVDAHEPRGAAKSVPIFAMGPKRLFTFGLFEFSLIAFAVVIGFAQQFEFILPFGWEEVEAWFNQPDARAETIRQVQWLTGIVGIAGSLAAVIAVGFATGVIRTVLRDWDFRLERTAKGFRRRRGLLTRSDVVMPAHRVQALIVGTRWFRKRFGWHRLSFISLAQDAGSANHDVAPFAQTEEIAPIVQAAGFTLPDHAMQWRQPSARYYADRAVFFALLLGIPAILTIALVDEDFGLWIGLSIAAIAVFSVIEQFWLWQVDRHGLDPEQVLSRHGWLAPRLQIASRVKLHSVEIAQGPIARRRGYATLYFGLAGGNLRFRGLDIGDAKRLRAAVLASIASVDFAQLPR